MSLLELAHFDRDDTARNHASWKRSLRESAARQEPSYEHLASKGYRILPLNKTPFNPYKKIVSGLG